MFIILFLEQGLNDFFSQHRITKDNDGAQFQDTTDGTHLEDLGDSGSRLHGSSTHQEVHAWQQCSVRKIQE